MSEENVTTQEPTAPTQPTETTTEPQQTGETVQAPPADTPTESAQEPPIRSDDALGTYELPPHVPQELGLQDWAKEQNLTQEQLTSSLGKFEELTHGLTLAKKRAIKQAGLAHTKNWGAAKQDNINLIKTTLNRVDPEGGLTKMLNDEGLINHPATLDALLNLGKMLKEGGFIRGEMKRPPGQKTAAQVMYPDLPSSEQ